MPVGVVVVLEPVEVEQQQHVRIGPGEDAVELTEQREAVPDAGEQIRPGQVAGLDDVGPAVAVGECEADHDRDDGGRGEAEREHVVRTKWS